MPTTWNPADLSNVTLTGSNLIATVNTSTTGGARSAASLNSGKYYWENTWTIATNTLASGISLSSANLVTPAAGNARVVRVTGTITINGTSTGVSISGGSAVPNLSVLCFAIDFTALLFWARIGAAGQWNGSGTANPATATGGLSIAAIAGALFASMSGQSTDRVTANFGDTAFIGAVPAGFTSGFPVIVPSTQSVRVQVLA